MTQIDLAFFQKMIQGGLNSLELETNYINKLNVFPVPDGDTGTNLKMTLAGALNDLKGETFSDFESFGKQFSRSLLMNARGNSGVIFSQMMSGFCAHFQTNQTVLTVQDFLTSFADAKLRTYKAVSNPKEGTILTVVRLINENLTTTADLETLFQEIIKNGNAALAKTPEFLKELAQAGVVDSGGYGVMSFLRGMNAVLRNELENYLKTLDEDFVPSNQQAENLHEMGDCGFGYCSEIVLELNSQIDPSKPEHKVKFNEKSFLKGVNNLGNSVVFVNEGNLVKVHVHTMTPYKLLKFGQKYGEFLKIKIENMTNQFIENRKEILDNVNERKYLPGTTLIATVPTAEIAKILQDDYGVKYTIVTNGENSSVKTFIEKIYLAGTKNVIIITDDKNLVMGANEACNVVKKNVEAAVISARNVFESLAVITNFDSDLTMKQNLKEMNKVLKSTSSGMVTISIKDISYPDLEVQKGDRIGIIDGKIVVANNDLLKTLKQTFDLLLAKSKDYDLCYLIYGKNISQKTVDAFTAYAEEKGIYCECQFGNQTTYDFYLGLQ